MVYNDKKEVIALNARRLNDGEAPKDDEILIYELQCFCPNSGRGFMFYADNDELSVLNAVEALDSGQDADNAIGYEKLAIIKELLATP